MNKKKECGHATEVYSRVVGYYRPVQNWNKGKKEEFEVRKTFKLNEKVAGVAVTCACETRDERISASA